MVATASPNRADIMSEELLLHIPVTTTTNNVTFANLFCAICHGEEDFDFWNSDVSLVSDCLAAVLEESVKTGAGYNVSDVFKACTSQRVEGTINPRPTEKVRLRLNNDVGAGSYSRFSKFCLNKDYFFQCQLKERQDQISADNIQHCSDGSVPIYLICTSSISPDFIRCDKCSSIDGSVNDYFDDNSNKANHSYREMEYEGDSHYSYDDYNDVACHKQSEIDADWLHFQFMLFFAIRFTDTVTIRMIVNGPGLTRMEYECFGNAEILEPQKCAESQPCVARNDSSNDCNLSTNMSTSSCTYQNPFTGVCLKVPCGQYKTNKCNDTSQDDDHCRKRTPYATWEDSTSDYILLLSVVFLFITVLLLIFMPELQTSFSYYQINCYLAHLISNVFIFVSASVGHSRRSCVLSAVFLHFALLSSFSWMVVIGGLVFARLRSLNRQVANISVRDPNTRRVLKRTVSHIMGHGVPAVFVILCFIVDKWLRPGYMSYGQGPFCWIHHSQGLLTSFIIPSGVVLLVNFMFFLGCFFTLIQFYINNRALPRHSYMFFVTVKMLIGTGLQWSLGIALHFYPDKKAMQFVFIVLVSGHGILIFITTLLQRVVRRRMTQFALSFQARILA